MLVRAALLVRGSRSAITRRPYAAPVSAGHQPSASLNDREKDALVPPVARPPSRFQPGRPLLMVAPHRQP